MSATAQLRELRLVETATIRVALYDPHPVALAGLEACIEDWGDMRVDVVATDCEELLALDQSGRLEADLVIADVTAGMSHPVGRTHSLAFVKAMSASGRTVVVFGDSGVPGVSAGLLAAGARGVVSKRETLARLGEIVRRVMSEDVFDAAMDAGLDRTMVACGTERGAHETLTAREGEIFVLLAQCLTPKEVAYDLHLALSTVYTHADRIRRKLGVSTLSELVSYAARWGILDA